MRTRGACTLLVVLTLVAPSLVARDLVEVGVGFSSVYDASYSTDVSSFFEGMADGERWTIGLGLGFRLSILDLGFMVFPCGDGEQDTEVMVLGSADLSIPIVHDVVYLRMGAGLRTEFLFPKDGEEARMLSAGVSAGVSELDAALMLYIAPIHLRIGFDVLAGPVVVSCIYVHETMASLAGLGEPDGWTSLLQAGDMDHLGIAFRLALF